jgi:hypothetical protein
LDLATYLGRMLGKFTDSARLQECAQRIGDGGQAFKDAQDAYETLIGQLLATRVDASFENYLSDQHLRAVQRQAQLADGRRGGRIATAIFPKGSGPIVRLQGESQIAAMRQVEARLGGVADIWPEATAAQQTVATHRGRYEVALKARDDAELAINNSRINRDAMKRRFLDLYAEIAALVKAEFPRNKMMQDLFFDTVHSPSSRGNRRPDPAKSPAAAATAAAATPAAADTTAAA